MEWWAFEISTVGFKCSYISDRSTKLKRKNAWKNLEGMFINKIYGAWTEQLMIPNLINENNNYLINQMATLLAFKAWYLLSQRIKFLSSYYHKTK